MSPAAPAPHPPRPGTGSLEHLGQNAAAAALRLPGAELSALAGGAAGPAARR